MSVLYYSLDDITGIKSRKIREGGREREEKERKG